MPIQPFIDRPKVDISRKYNTSVTPTSGTLASGDLHAHTQGVSVGTFVDTTHSLIPFLSSNGFPDSASGRINFSINQTTYGAIRLFDESNNGIDVSPYDDIANLNNPVKFLDDSGITAYPQVMLSPNWLDPGMMNGIIEPLQVRGTLPGASIESPFVAHTVRASLLTGDGTGSSIVPYVFHHGTLGSTGDTISVYIDSQDTLMGSLDLSIPGISDFEPGFAGPYDDDTVALEIRNDLGFQDTSDFNDFTGVGLISKGASNTVFNYNPTRSVTVGQTGIRNVSGVDSLAFGGMTR